LARSRGLGFAGCGTGAPELAKLTVAAKDALIPSLLPVVRQLERELARNAQLEDGSTELLARLARLERRGQTPKNFSLLASKGQQPDGPAPGAAQGPPRCRPRAEVAS